MLGAEIKSKFQKRSQKIIKLINNKTFSMNLFLFSK